MVAIKLSWISSWKLLLLLVFINKLKQENSTNQEADTGPAYTYCTYWPMQGTIAAYCKVIHLMKIIIGRHR
jgi:hypothetical protein